jgi:uncharacterized tellurite resistance protein B-like protein
MSLLRWLGLETSPMPAPVDSVAEIEKALAGLPPEQATYLACFAYILSRVARADQQVSDEESRVMAAMIADRGSLPPEQAALVVRIATAEAWRHGGTEDFIVSRRFDGIATRDQKRALLDCLFAVSAADSAIHTVEDNAIRQIVSEIRLEHADFIAARAAHRRHLAVLRKPESGRS